MTVTAFFAQHGLSLLEGATGTAVFVAIAKHMPDWPLSWKGLYEWVKGSIQEIAAQRSGGSAENPIVPAKTPDTK